MSILHAATRIAFASTIAGGGLSLGRDAYNRGKSNLGIIVLLFIVFSFLYGIYKGGFWFAQNYPDMGKAENIIARTFAGILGLFCYGTVLAISAALYINATGLEAPPFLPITEFTQHPLYEPFMAEFLPRLFTTDTTLGIIWILLTSLLCVGLWTGYSRRKKRQLEHEAEVHNQTFFHQHGLQSIQDDRLRDSQNIGYHLENVLKNELEFKVAGQRGKRAYLEFDSTGKYTSWSGVVAPR